MGNICNVKKTLLFKPCIGIKDTCVAEGSRQSEFSQTLPGTCVWGMQNNHSLPTSSQSAREQLLADSPPHTHTHTQKRLVNYRYARIGFLNSSPHPQPSCLEWAARMCTHDCMKSLGKHEIHTGLLDLLIFQFHPLFLRLELERWLGRLKCSGLRVENRQISYPVSFLSGVIVGTVAVRTPLALWLLLAAWLPSRAQVGFEPFLEAHVHTMPSSFQWENSLHCCFLLLYLSFYDFSLSS